MERHTLLDFFDSFAVHRQQYLVYDNGFRSWTYTYQQIGNAAQAFAAKLQSNGIAPGDKVLIWSENRPEWIVALWGCLLAGAVLVPLDYRASADFLQRVRTTVQAKLVLLGEEVLWEAGNSWKLSEIEWPVGNISVPRGPINSGTLAEIIFTSGATAEPKGVTITHRNILANVVPIEREIRKYQPWSRLVAPVRFLNLLPLSHLFGQAMSAFIPPLLPGEVVFMQGQNPREIIRQVRSRNILVIVAVPKILEILREFVKGAVPSANVSAPSGEHWLRRWWRYRRVHRLFGWRFLSFVVGAAPLDPELEQFWSQLGFLVIQGYGLTETAPIVTLNHPFHRKSGTVGKPIAGVEVKIAPDGEILVRGENVTSGYYSAEGVKQEALQNGWFHTGDIGSLDAEGRLQIRGRKKEMIVTPEGLNVFPEDVERVLNALPGVRESAVIGRDRVHAVLLLEPGTDQRQIQRIANGQLEDHQQVRTVSVWPGAELPRTEGTKKLKRGEIARWASEGLALPQTKQQTGLAGLLAKFAPGTEIQANTTLGELGLSSLERIELATALEQTCLAPETKVADLANASATVRSQEPVLAFPTWNQSLLARVLRGVTLPILILPLTRYFARVEARNTEMLSRIKGPVIFAANHQSFLDTPSLLLALPYQWRAHLAPAMSKEFFPAHFHKESFTLLECFKSSLSYYLACLFFFAFPLPQREAGTHEAFQYMGTLISGGNSLLIFPEGRMATTEAIQPFQPGIGLLASRLQIPVVPVRLEGLTQVLPRTSHWPTPGRVVITFGEPLHLRGKDYGTFAQEVEQAVRALGT